VSNLNTYTFEHNFKIGQFVEIEADTKEIAKQKFLKWDYVAIPRFSKNVDVTIINHERDWKLDGSVGHKHLFEVHSNVKQRVVVNAEDYDSAGDIYLAQDNYIVEWPIGDKSVRIYHMQGNEETIGCEYIGENIHQPELELVGGEA
jgi:hypothetical protein